jgi:thymidine phosphorylase
MLHQEIIRKKRDNTPLSTEEIQSFVQGIASGTLTDGHVAAFGMAIFFNGMSKEECVSLTLAMKESGTTLTWEGLSGPVVDKHSTGGVGDSVSLMLAPMLAGCGAYVPMISGRGLGHTGGTLDKLDSIPGYNTAPSPEEMKRVVKQVGAAIVGQTSSLAPADRRFYAVRDVTATVESIPLITASILSKKLAEGLDALVMDVKVGSGAFMPTFEKSRILAETIVEVANGAGLPTSALLSDMNEALAPSAGNSLEVKLAIDYLTGVIRPARLHEVIVGLASELLLRTKLVADRTAAVARLERVLDSGAAAENFARMVSALGGPSDLIDHPERHLSNAPIKRPVPAMIDGFVSRVDTRELGMSIVRLGGGRASPEDRIDYSVGLSEILPVGTPVSATTPLMWVHASNENDAERAMVEIRDSVRITNQKPVVESVIHARIS